MTKKKVKAIMVLIIFVIILLSIVTVVTGLVYLSFPLLILLCTILISWAIKTFVEWCIININYNKLKTKTIERTKKVAAKIKIEEGKKILKESIEELRGRK